MEKNWFRSPFGFLIKPGQGSRRNQGVCVLVGLDTHKALSKLTRCLVQDTYWTNDHTCFANDGTLMVLRLGCEIHLEVSFVLRPVVQALGFQRETLGSLL